MVFSSKGMRGFFQAPIIFGISKLLPKNFINVGIQSIGFVWDRIDSFRGQQTDLLPPFALRMEVNSQFRASSYEAYGREFRNYFITLCNLKKDARVLDVGCGTGIIAATLTEYLNSKGSYDGFDIDKSRINWCSENITANYPNFRFKLINIYNGKYNPDGRKKASTFKFPYQDYSFDLVILSSVFTHMLPGDVENYVTEIRRVMKAGGKSLITYLLVNPTQIVLEKRKLSSLNLQYSFKHYKTISLPEDNSTYEEAVAYNEDYIRRLYIKKGLRIDEPIHYGAWSGRTKFLGKQDIVVATKV